MKDMGSLRGACRNVMAKIGRDGFSKAKEEGIEQRTGLRVATGFGKYWQSWASLQHILGIA